MGYEVDFLPADKRESFLLVDSMALYVLTRHAQSTQNNKLVISLQYLQEKVKDEVYFLPADKHKGFFKLILSS